MKSIILSHALMLVSFLGMGQILEPVSWDFKVTANDDGTYTFVATADIDDGWAIYSQHIEDGGPIPLQFEYESAVQLLGTTSEDSEAIKVKSKLFDMQVIKFENEAIFTQKFKPEAGISNIKGYLTFMCCDKLRCLPPTDVDFDVAL